MEKNLVYHIGLFRKQCWIAQWDIGAILKATH